MKAEVKGKLLIIEIELESPTLSSSGKSMVVASTHGFVKTSAVVDGKEVSLSINAIIKL